MEVSQCFLFWAQPWQRLHTLELKRILLPSRMTFQLWGRIWIPNLVRIQSCFRKSWNTCIKKLSARVPPATGSSEQTQTDDRGKGILGLYGEHTPTSVEKGKLGTKYAKMECPKFSNEDFPGWLTKIEQFFDVDDTKETEKIQVMMMHLSGELILHIEV